MASSRSSEIAGEKRKWLKFSEHPGSAACSSNPDVREQTSRFAGQGWKPVPVLLSGDRGNRAHNGRIPGTRPGMKRTPGWVANRRTACPPLRLVRPPAGRRTTAIAASSATLPRAAGRPSINARRAPRRSKPPIPAAPPRGQSIEWRFFGPAHVIAAVSGS